MDCLPFPSTLSSAVPPPCGAALGVIILLDLIVGKMISIFGQIKPLAGYLNYPYLLWLCYATYLNFIFMSTQGAVVEF